jgi:hypothetical protein
MASIEYSLFRVKFIKSNPPSLFHSDLTPSELFLRAVQEKPSAELREGYLWHIGNVRFFVPQTGYFAIGRTTKSTIEKYDPMSGNFLEEELETSPYTHCVFNAEIGIIGIAQKSALSPSVKGIAGRIQQLLSRSIVVSESSTTVEIAPIPDPEGFLLTFHGPNPFDADEHFQKPLSVYLSSANGEKGRAQIQGQDLNRDVLQSVTRSTAATGNEAAASITKSKSQKPHTIHLRGDPVKRRYDEEEHLPEAVLEDLEKLYSRVRKNETG